LSLFVVCALVGTSAEVLTASPASAVGCATPAKGEWSGVWTSGRGFGSGNFFGKLSFKPTTTPGDYTVAGKMTITGSVATGGGSVRGTLACDGSFLFGAVIATSAGAVDTNFSGTMSGGGTTASGTYSLAGGEDSGSWVGGLLAVGMSPIAGEAGSSVTVSTTTGMFVLGESVTVSYATRLASPATVTLCSGTADATTGAFSCTGTIPTVSTGPLGMHTITATGTSGLTAKTKYNVTF
jgi:hypothetical protein